MNASIRISDRLFPNLSWEQPSVTEGAEEFGTAFCFSWHYRRFFPVAKNYQHTVRSPETFILKADSSDVGPPESLIPGGLQMLQDAHSNFYIVVLDLQQFAERLSLPGFPPRT